MSRIHHHRSAVRSRSGLHVVRALQQRELLGPPASSSFSCSVSRSTLNLRFGVDSIIQKHFLQDGHVVMGFTPCVRYMITYVVRGISNNLVVVDDSSSSLFTYTLYFWTFVPHRFAHVHSSITIFDTNGVNDPNLHITIAFTHKFAVIHGRSSLPEDLPRGYLTVTSVPDTKNPSPNLPVTSLTTSVTFDLVPPYPPFPPATSISYEAPHLSLLVNTGSHLHSLTLNTHHHSPPHNKHALFDLTDANSHSNSSWTLTQHVRSLLLNTTRVPNNTSPPLTTTQAKKRNRFFRRRDLQQQQLLPPPQKILSSVYDSIDTVEEKMSFKMYRKRQLADKMYEFSDEENNIPTQRTRTPPSPNSSHLILRIPKSTHFLNSTYLISPINNNDSTTAAEEEEEQEESLFPVALPVQVLHPTIGQLPSTPNTTSRGTSSSVFKLSQVTLDLEVLSHEVAALACKLERTQLNYIIDYDSKVLNFNKHTVTTFTQALLQTSNKHKSDLESETTTTPPLTFDPVVSSSGRFELSFVFEWHPLLNTGKVVFRPKLRPVPHNNPCDPWNPTKDIAPTLNSANNSFAPLDNFFLAHQYSSLTSLEDPSGTVTVYQNSHLHTCEDSSEASSTLSSPPYLPPTSEFSDSSSDSSD